MAFSDGSVTSIKAVLINSTDGLPSISVAYSRNCNESYETTKLILSLVEYSTFECKVGGDLKISE